MKGYDRATAETSMRRWRVRSAGKSEAPQSPVGDAALVAAARHDRRAFAPLYQRYRDDLLRYCYYCLGDWDDAADATQQIFANAMAGLPAFVDHGDSFRPWLFRIAHNEVLSRQQRRTRRPQSQLLDAAEVVDQRPSPEDLAIAADDHQRLWMLLAHLPPDRQRVCELRFAGLTDREIAGVLGKSLGAVRTAQSRAVAQLRELMGVTLAPTGGIDG
jgi:RNA polymerase sigma-70 factor (ECF subfamily)